MAAGYSTNLRNLRLNAVRDLLDSGTGPATLDILNGTRPATGGTATTNLADLTFSDPSAPNATAGVLTFNTITPDTNANATSVATWARAFISDGTFVMDLGVGVTGSGEDITFGNVNFQISTEVGIPTAAITAGNP